MKIPVGELKTEVGREASYSMEYDAPPMNMEGDMVVFPAPVAVDASLVNTGASILAWISLKGVARLRCSRCLKTFDWPVKSRFEAEFREGNRKALDEEVIYYTGDQIELDDIVRQHILLDLPMKPLCDEACKGLCPVCGADLNVGECGCRRPEGDIRFAALGDLLKKMPN